MCGLLGLRSNTMEVIGHLLLCLEDTVPHSLSSLVEVLELPENGWVVVQQVVRPRSHFAPEIMIRLVADGMCEFLSCVTSTRDTRERPALPKDRI